MDNAGQLDKISYELGQIHGKLDRVIDELSFQRVRIVNTIRRVEHVEQRMFWLAGVGAAVGGVLAFAGGTIAYALELFK